MSLSYYLLSPEICLCGFALLVILLDLFLPNKKILAAVSIIGLVATLGLSLSLWGKEESIFSNMLAVDQFTIFFQVLFAGIAIVVILASTDYVSKLSRYQGEYYALILISVIGMMLMASARELISLYISLELTSISLYVLTGILKDRKSTEAGIKYLLLGAVASAVLLYGMALIYGLTGQTHLSDIAVSLTTGGMLDSPALLLGLVFLIAGFGFKIASVPFQMWVPDVYEGAPTPITAFLSVASKAAGFAIILRVFLEAFAGDASTFNDWTMVIAVLSVITMTVGNVVAISQTNIKRMLGYSGIAQAGYLMVGLAAASVVGQTLGQNGILFFLVAYAATNLGAFIVIIAFSNKTNSDAIADYAGMGKRAPLLALALTLCLVSLTGLPPTVGFLAKLYIFSAAVQNDLLWVVIIAVINTIISAYYYFRVVKVMWFSEPASEEKVPSSWALRAGLSIACLAVLMLFFFPSWLMKIAEAAAGVFS